MDIGSILLIISLSILAAMFVFRPFFTFSPEKTGLNERVKEEINLLDHQYSALLAEKERLLNALQELEIDNSMGKIPEEDYPNQRAELLATGAQVLRELDDVESRLQKNSAVEAMDRQAEEILPVATGNVNSIEEMIAARRRLRDEKSAGFCPRCGKVIQKSDDYCPKCGSKVSA